MKSWTQRIIGYAFAAAVVIGVARRLAWVVSSHSAFWARGLTLALSLLAVVILIDSIRHHERIWPPTRRQYVIALIAGATVCFVDVPGYLSLVGGHAKDQILGRAERGQPNVVLDMQDGALVAMGDDFIGGAFSRWPHIATDIDAAFDTTAATCPAAIAKIDSDERGFETEAVAFAAVNNARVHAKCALSLGHRLEARAWIEQAARAEVPPITRVSVIYEQRLWIDASLIAAGLHDSTDLAYFKAKADRTPGRPLPASAR